ncbi:glycosylhydrolase family 61-5 [Diaporthe helianthi]|uniref:lytic cellulose monooxygenase (C4-dehydrogenating) n=1 Tax=Diaporthe helianthi TaxID=158607 RepID=A0A2P5HH88_DIAHE|nr:glycosylhydrolase family 61-5 [Diaporthe helianthi]
MKYAFSAALATALAAKNVVAHATFQQLWVDGTDYDTSCARIPLSNSPVQDVTSKDMACNAGTSPVASKCDVPAGSTVTVEMHQQPNDRSCSNEAIGGAHYGPVLVYMAAVDDAASAEGADAAWFKVFQDTWSSGGASGSDDNWGTKDLNTCCGKMDVPIPKDLAPGDYLLRAEAIALHAAGSAGGAQFYMTCYQISVSGDGTATAETVSIPGAYKAADPGVEINIYQAMAEYVAPGPAVYAGGSEKIAGSECTNCESTCAPGDGPAATAGSGSPAGSSPSSSSAAAAAAAAVPTSAAAPTSAAPASTTLATSVTSQVATVASSTTSQSAPAATASKPAECKRRRSRIARNL